jgi:hypothetical protein
VHQEFQERVEVMERQSHLPQLFLVRREHKGPLVHKVKQVLLVRKALLDLRVKMEHLDLQELQEVQVRLVPLVQLVHKALRVHPK